jgi:hypothetical protein
LKDSNWARPHACGRLSDATDRPRSHADIVRKFIRDWRDEVRRAREYFADKKCDPSDAIRRAVLPYGKRNRHQRPASKADLQRAAEALINANLADEPLGDFAALHAAVSRTIRHLPNIGELTVYDVADRFGAYLGLEPDLVYLHAGAREGARALGVRGTAVPKSAFPTAFHQLSPGEIEDCMCLYKDDLRRLASTK